MREPGRNTARRSLQFIFCWLAVFYLSCHLFVCCLMKIGNDKMKCVAPSPMCTDRKFSECHLLNLDLPHLVDPTPLTLLSPPLLYQGSHSLDGSFPQAGTACESYCLRSYFYFCCCDPWQQWGGKGYSAYSSRLQCTQAGKTPRKESSRQLFPAQPQSPAERREWLLITARLR